MRFSDTLRNLLVESDLALTMASLSSPAACEDGYGAFGAGRRRCLKKPTRFRSTINQSSIYSCQTYTFASFNLDLVPPSSCPPKREL
jgi:hypothetical protein